MKHSLPLLLLLFSYTLSAQHLIPQPKKIKVDGYKSYTLKKNLKQGSPKLLTQIGCTDEYYLSIRRGRATFVGNKIWAQQTLRQLQNEEGKVPNVTIHDWASYPIRAFMHDVGRNFQPISMLEHTIDLMSLYKLNYFHWHLTDNPAWRIECKCHPELNDAKNHRPGRDQGKFYTYNDIRHLCNYAAQRGITIIPEIDMPGHSQYFTTTFGVSMNSKEGMKILEELLEEFFTEIPADICPYFHIGSDEIHINNPEEFMTFAENIVKTHHRQAIAWDPGLPASDTTIRQIWNEADGTNAAATNRNGRYLDSFIGYLNYYDPLTFTNRLFLHQAGAQEIADTSKCLGGDLCLWNDIRVDDKSRISLHNGMINGIMAFSERFWNGGSGGNDTKNDNVLPSPATTTGKNLAQFEEKMTYHRNHLLQNEDIRWVANSQIHWHISINNDTIEAWGGAIDLEALCRVNEITITDTMVAVAETQLFVPRDTTITAWVGFETIARSNRISTGIALQGEWENQGQLLINGSALPPSTQWNQPGAYAYHYNTWHRPEEEIPLTDEQLYWMRQPAIIPLHAGENIIRLTIKKQFQGHRWSFAFLPITTLPTKKVVEATRISY